MALIQLEQIGREFPGPPKVRALDRVNLVVEEGEYVSLIGPSGSGKSTLLNIIGMLDTPTSGRYLFNDIDTAGFSDAQRTRFRGAVVGFVFQDFHLMPGRDAAENVEVPLVYAGFSRKQAAERAHEVLQLVDLGHREHAYPTTMSGGERQRVAIARALATGPSVLLCDEPTGNLDSKTAHAVLDLVDDLRLTGVSVLTITHDPVTAARADRRVTIMDGRTIEDTDG
jgi:putative ABC transport system ATP-binding protein